MCDFMDFIGSLYHFIFFSYETVNQPASPRMIRGSLLALMFPMFVRYELQLNTNLSARVMWRGW